jgi:hypothetical protein
MNHAGTVPDATPCVGRSDSLSLAPFCSCTEWYDALCAHMQVYELYNLVPFGWNNISWMSIARQLPTAVALALVCSFGTPMDIAAVQAQVDFDINSDHEVNIIGCANLAAGLFAGGGTGTHGLSMKQHA